VIWTPTPSTSHLPRRRIVRRPDRADAGRLAEAVARWYVEVVSGRRPFDPLPLLTPAVASRVECCRRRAAERRAAARRAGRVPDPAGTAQVVRVSVQWPAPSTCEALVLVRTGPRTTAVTVTLQVSTAGWRVTDLAAPEDGMEALRPPALPRGAAPLEEPHRPPRGD
jgi:hypothetical protein